MPRTKSPYPNFKAYGFSIVVHNVLPEAKEIFTTFVAETQPEWSVIALEPYPKSSGFHLHIFLKWKRQHRSVKWFNFHHDTFRRIISEKPQDAPDGEWGRIQVDPLKGDKDYCLKYLVNPGKNKALDPDVEMVDNVRLAKIDRWAQAAARLNRKFMFPETHGEDIITCIQYCKFLEDNNRPIPDYYASDWRTFNSQLQLR